MKKIKCEICGKVEPDRNATETESRAMEYLKVDKICNKCFNRILEEIKQQLGLSEPSGNKK